MKETERIVQQMIQGFETDAWHGPSLMEILEDVTARQAAARPIKDAHTIWELVMHLTTWQEQITKRVSGYTGYPSDEENFPPMPEPTEKNWQRTLDNLQQGEEELHRTVASFDDTRLDQPLVARGSSAYNQFHGHAQHLAYHAGQIVMLKKLL